MYRPVELVYETFSAKQLTTSPGSEIGWSLPGTCKIGKVALARFPDSRRINSQTLLRGMDEVSEDNKVWHDSRFALRMTRWALARSLLRAVNVASDGVRLYCRNACLRFAIALRTAFVHHGTGLPFLQGLVMGMHCVAAVIILSVM